ncbi:protein phosphatase inhibitor 2-like [Mustelus asterias]
MNIIATYKPPGKNYGQMAINEPKTPYSYSIEEQPGSSTNHRVSMEDLSSRMSNLNQARKGKVKKPKIKKQESDEEDIPIVDREKRRQFELRRKQIYNEGKNIQHARDLMAHEDMDDHDDSD